MSVADFRIEPATGPYVLGPDGRLQPLDRKKDLRARIRAVLRNQGIVADIARGVEERSEIEAPLWAHAVDMSEDAETEVQVA